MQLFILFLNFGKPITITRALLPDSQNPLMMKRHCNRNKGDSHRRLANG